MSSNGRDFIYDYYLFYLFIIFSILQKKKP